MIFEKIRERLEEEKQRLRRLKNDCIALSDSEVCAIEEQAYNFCKDIVNQVETEYNNGWISVDDELPEPYKSVLVLEENGEIHLCRYHDNCKRFYYDGSDWDIKLGCVTHWQPLPQPPKGE